MTERGAPIGNTNGGRGKPLTDALRLAMFKEVAVNGGKRSRRITIMADKVATLACEGVPWAVSEVLNRLEGKPAQALTIDATIEHVDTDPMALIMARLQGIAERSAPVIEHDDEPTT